MASYYLCSTLDSYISYVNTPWNLDDGNPPPEKKFFANPQFFPEERQFTGLIEWVPITFGDCVRWEYKIVFNEDWKFIEDGTMDVYYLNGETETDYFGETLQYSKLENE